MIIRLIVVLYTSIAHVIIPCGIVCKTETNISHNFVISQVYVVPPAQMLFLPSRVEAVIGHNLSLPVQVKGYTDESKITLLAFPDCHRLEVEITTTDTTVFNITKELNKGVMLCVNNQRREDMML